MNTHDYNNLYSRILIDNFVFTCKTIPRALDFGSNNDYDLKTKTSLCDKSDVLCSQREKKSNTGNYKVHIARTEKLETARIRKSMTFFTDQTARKAAFERLLAHNIVSSSTSSTISKPQVSTTPISSKQHHICHIQQRRYPQRPPQQLTSLSSTELSTAISRSSSSQIMIA